MGSGANLSGEKGRRTVNAWRVYEPAQVGGHVPALSPCLVLDNGYPPCLGHDNAYLSGVRLWAWLPNTLPMSLP